MSLHLTPPGSGRTPGELASTNAFVNALLREWPHWTHHRREQLPAGISTAQAGVDGGVLLPLPGHALSVWLPLAHWSLAGRHAFALPLWLARDNGAWQPGSLAELVALIATEPAIAGRNATPQLAWLFIKRVADSALNLAAAEAARLTELSALSWPEAGYLAAEQGLVYGHAVHPTPKSRDEFSADDVRAYSPEFASRFALEWLALAPEALWSVDCDGLPASARLAGLITDDPALSRIVAQNQLPDDWLLLPVHPWQARVLKHHPSYEHWIRAGRLKELGAQGVDWYPTSSLRTLYAPGQRYMLKHSLSVRLTNSKRVLQPAEVARGALVHGAFMSPLGRELAERCPTLAIMHERAAFALANLDGSPLAESFVLLRDNPFAERDTTYVMATLCQDGPDGTPGMLGKLVTTLAEQSGEPAAIVAERWFGSFLDVALRPFLIAMSDFGFLFSAHQQNMVLGLAGGYPSRVYFRDCQGTTFSTATIERLKPHVPGIEAALELQFSQAETNCLCGYYLIVNNVFNVISVLGAAGVADEVRLARLMRRFLLALKAEGLADTAFVDYLLTSPEIEAKGNFMICLRNVNETTEPDGSFRSYVPLANPIYHCTDSESRP
ncbi:IucA/IucC family protein [Crenobacter sp. SG2303]|uniref:IucA/IucC family protein n=1 Tax=Crenobacter oryzisoli TaxID=3056844 RepID=A0ABT7XQM8_9NEIS|nr:IucA/IucC family protein [Crenobacter sp. SG2303]MDN0076107.1 IucA/IucC family protein [Crenobacter sp. SG2303]